MTTSPKSAQTIDIEVTRTIPATPEQVYDAWVDYKHPGGPWFGADKILVNLAVDGLFYHCAMHQGRKWAHYGRFVALERARRIEYTWVSEGTKGLETTVTLTFARAGEGTAVTLLHRGLPDDQGDSHRGGWTSILGVVADRLAGKPA